MTWLKEKILLIVGACIALITTYLLGRKDASHAIKNKTNEKLIKQAYVIRDVHNMDDDELVKRMLEYGDE